MTQFLSLVCLLGSLSLKVISREWFMYETLIEVVLSPFWFFQDPSQRLYWVFILSSLLMACLVVRRSVVRFVSRLYQTPRKKMLSKEYILKLISWQTYWWHPSSRFDLILFMFNRVLKLAIFLPIIGSHIAVAMLTAQMCLYFMGDSPSLNLSYGVMLGVFSIVLFVCEDASRFLLHFAFHRVPWLWRFHKIHHSAEVLTPLTLYRSHPVEVFLFSLRSVLVVGGVSGIFVYLFKGRISGWEILGVDALGFVFNFMAANLRHSHIPLSFGRFERVFISPAQHQIHHSKDKEHRNKNFGVCLSIWDQMAGSWVKSRANQSLSFGLSPEKDQHNFKALVRAFTKN